MGNKRKLPKDETEYSIKDSLEFLNVTPQTVLKYLNNGTLKGKKIGPRSKWVIKGREIKNLMIKWNMLDKIS